MQFSVYVLNYYHIYIFSFYLCHSVSRSLFVQNHLFLSKILKLFDTIYYISTISEVGIHYLFHNSRIAIFLTEKNGGLVLSLIFIF